MEKVLVLAHTEVDGSLKQAAFEAIGAARELQGELMIGLIGEQAEAAAARLATAGATRVLAVTGAEFGQSRFATDAAAAVALVKAAGAEIVIVPATARFNRVIAAVAHRLGGRSDTHVTAITQENGLTVSRWYYRQRMEAKLKRQHRPWCIALDPGCQKAWCPTEQPSSAGPVAIEPVQVSVPPESIRTTVTGMRSAGSDKQTIRPEAELLFVAGAGWTKKQSDGQVHADLASSLILDFLDNSQASLGGSKSVVDLGGEGQAVLPFMTHMNQIGQTGATPRHQKGLSTCCHGEEPHVVGWRFITERRAVNLDVNCSWAQGKCDVLYVADAFKVMERVNQLIKEKKPVAAVTTG